MAKKTIQQSIKHPGALTNRAQRNGRSINAEAEHDRSASGLKGQQARYYLNVLRPAAAHRRHGDGPTGHFSGH